MDEFITDRTAGPAAAEKGLVAIQTLLADGTPARLDIQQKRLPITAGHSNAHGAQYSQPPF
ncbi:MAG: hypothetical protein AB7G48_02925 [Nitrospiraceae bacterium]